MTSSFDDRQQPGSRPGDPQEHAGPGSPAAGAPPPGYAPQGTASPASPPQGYPAQGYAPPGHPPSGYGAPSYPQPGYPPPGYPPQGYPQQGYPPPGFAPTGYGPPPYYFSPIEKPIGWFIVNWLFFWPTAIYSLVSYWNKIDPAAYAGDLTAAQYFAAQVRKQGIIALCIFGGLMVFYVILFVVIFSTAASTFPR